MMLTNRKGSDQYCHSHK